MLDGIDAQRSQVNCLFDGLLDLDKGVDLALARRSSWAVLGVSLALTALFGAKLW